MICLCLCYCCLPCCALTPAAAATVFVAIISLAPFHPPDHAAAAGAGAGAAAVAAQRGPSEAEAEQSMSAALHEVVHEVLGDGLTLDEAQQMLNEVDKKHQGKISLAEVRRVWVGGGVPRCQVQALEP